MTTIVAILVAGLVPGQIQIPVDPATSTHTVELCVQGVCDNDVSPLSGELTAELDSRGNPTQVSLQDFNLQADQDLDLHLDYGLLGDLYATITGLGFYHADPGPHQPFYPITNGQYTIVNVPSLSNGIAVYNATGGVCLSLILSGLPCSDTIDLTTWPESILDAISGTIQIVDHVLYVTGTIAFTSLIDPNNPDLGTISQTSVINGSVLLPQPGDYNGDGDVDYGDYELFEACASGPAIPLDPGCEDKDFDSDNDVDQSDFGIFQRCFGGPDILGDLSCAE
ncbi:MAG: hypothetical protein ACYTF1_01240 [Planctomycetota bacterium]|jgi:hypothetical protein